MQSCTIELVSNASGQRFPDKTLGRFAIISPGQPNLEWQSEVAISKTPHPSQYQKVKEGKFRFFGIKL